MREGDIEYSDDLADEIVDRISEGEPLRQICRDAHMPHWRTVYFWREERPELAARIARARIDGGHAIADRIRLTVRGKTEADGGDSTGDVQRDKLIADTDLKLLAKWFPKDYGDRQQFAPVDVDGAPAQFAPILFVPVEPKPREE